MCVSGPYLGHKSIKSRLISSACDNPIKHPQPVVGKFVSVAASPSRPLVSMFAIGFFFRVRICRLRLGCNPNT